MKYLKGSLTLVILCMLWVWVEVRLPRHSHHDVEPEFHGNVSGLDKATNGDFLVQVGTNIVVTNKEDFGIQMLRSMLSPTTYGYPSMDELDSHQRALISIAATAYEMGMRQGIKYTVEGNEAALNLSLEIAKEAQKK